jgi:ParB/RepB/Spo0J family partition protein
LYLETGEIELTGLNPRRDFDDPGLKELAASISAHGMIEPLVVTEDHRLIAGERRLRAAKLLGMKTVPVVVKDVSDDELPEIMLIENLQRKDLNCVEEAAGVAMLLAKGMTQEELAERICRSQSWVSGRARIALLPEVLKILAADGKLGPEAMTELTPFVGYPVMDCLAVELVNFNKRNKPKVILPEDVKDTIDSELENEEVAVDLEPDQWTREHEVMKTFNKKGCKGCQHILKRKTNYDGRKVHCLNAECGRPRFLEAESALKEREKKAAAKARADNKGGSSSPRAQTREYCPLTKEQDDWRIPKFDRSACSSCEDKFTATKGKRKLGRCSKPSCWEAKQKAAEEEIEKLMEATKKAVASNLEKVLEGRPFGQGEQRFVLGVLAEEVIRGMSNPLTNFVKRRGEDWRVSIKGIPKEKLGECMMRVAIAREADRLSYGAGESKGAMDNIRAYFPELLDGIVQERITAKAAKAEASGEDLGEGEDDDGEDQEGK